MDTQTTREVEKIVDRRSDPSELTTQQLLREISSLKELVLSRIEGMEKSIDIAHSDMVRVPTDVQKAVLNLRDLHDEKFHSVDKKFVDRIISVDQRIGDILNIVNERFLSVKDQFQDWAMLRDEKFAGVQKQFMERDVRVEQTARDTKVAVDAALQAAEKAVGKQNESFAQSINKSEAATMKQIDQQAALIGTATKALDDKINDAKERLTRIEGMSTGKKDFWGYIVGAIGLIATLISIFLYITEMKK